MIFWRPANRPPETAAGEPTAGAYRHWLVTIAERVVEAASSGVLGCGKQVSESAAARLRFTDHRRGYSDSDVVRLIQRGRLGVTDDTATRVSPAMSA